MSVGCFQATLAPLRAIEQEVSELLEDALLFRRLLRSACSGISRSRPALLSFASGVSEAGGRVGILTEQDAPEGPRRLLVLSCPLLHLLVAVLLLSRLHRRLPPRAP
jgi:hypothetical protein